MATISKRANGYFVQIRRKGYEPEYATFRTKAEAQKWATERENRIYLGQQPVGLSILRTTTLSDLIDRYLKEVTPTKASRESERLRLLKMQKAAFADITLHALSSAHISAYRDARAERVKPGTIARELSLLHNIIDIARRDWGIPLSSNVLTVVRRLPVRNARDRRLRYGELRSLRDALADTRNKFVEPAIMLAIETALRRGELLNITWQEIDYRQKTLRIPHTKTGYPRTIPLTDRAVSILKAIPVSEGRVFPLTPMALKLAWNRVRIRAGMPDLRFHDLRHEAISRFAEMGLSTVELAAISGHRDLRMLNRYTHIQPSALARKLAGRSWEREVGLVEVRDG